jgi:hypothetical protein
MSISRVAKLAGFAAILTLAMPTLSWAQTCGPFLSMASCGPRHEHCPPAFKYIFEGAPNIHWHRGCPHPICNPCDLPNWGYHETCWSPFPFAPNWAHCPMPPPAAFVHLNPYANVPITRTPPIRTLPATPQANPPSVPRNPMPFEELPAPRPIN